jgi:hypothetical protein
MKDCFAALAMTGDCFGLQPRNDEKKPAEAGF